MAPSYGNHDFCSHPCEHLGEKHQIVCINMCTDHKHSQIGIFLEVTVKKPQLGVSIVYYCHFYIVIEFIDTLMTVSIKKIID